MHLRLRPDELRDAQKAADQEGVTLSQWTRAAILQALGREPDGS